MTTRNPIDCPRRRSRVAAFASVFAVLALMGAVGTRAASAASLSFVLTGSSATQHSYALLASAENPILGLIQNSNFTAGAGLVTSLDFEHCSGPGTGAPPCFFELGSFTVTPAGGPGGFGFDLGLAAIDMGGGWNDATIAAMGKSGVFGRLTVNHTVLGPGDVILLADARGSEFDAEADESPDPRIVITPEPASLALAAFALACLSFAARSRARGARGARSGSTHNLEPLSGF